MDRQELHNFNKISPKTYPWSITDLDDSFEYSFILGQELFVPCVNPCAKKEWHIIVDLKFGHGNTLTHRSSSFLIYWACS